MTHSIRVLIADDSAYMRHGVVAALAPHVARTGITIVGEATTGAQAVAESRRLQPDVVLMDVRMPDRSGIEACREILSASTAPRILMLTAFADDDLVYESVLAGAHGYLMKELDPSALADAITDAAAGRPVMSHETNSVVLRVVRERSAGSAEERIAKLSAQQKKVLAAVASGLSNKQISEQLALSANTVRNYLVTIFKKLAVRRRSHAAALFVQSDARRK